MDDMSTQQAQCISYIAVNHATWIVATQMHQSIPARETASRSAGAFSVFANEDSDLITTGL